jgi:hypothetical protein
MNLDEFARTDVQDRLRSIILANMFNNPFRNYNSLNKLEKLNFKKELNIYIKDNLSGQYWEEILIKEYNEVVCAFMDDSTAFDPSKISVPTNFEPEFILTDEQKAFHGDIKSNAELCGESSVLKQLQSQIIQ